EGPAAPTHGYRYFRPWDVSAECKREARNRRVCRAALAVLAHACGAALELACSFVEHLFCLEAARKEEEVSVETATRAQVVQRTSRWSGRQCQSHERNRAWRAWPPVS